MDRPYAYSATIIFPSFLISMLRSLPIYVMGQRTKRKAKMYAFDGKLKVVKMAVNRM